MNERTFLLFQTSKDFDVALLELSSDVNVDQTTIRAACLPADDSNSYEGMTAITSGWGVIAFLLGPHPERLLKLEELTVRPPKDCGDYTKGRITDAMICAGAGDGKRSPCSNDSGGDMEINFCFYKIMYTYTASSSGPLVVKDTTTGRYTLVGVINFTKIGCTVKGISTVFARVSSILDWIKAETSGVSTCLP